MGVRERVRHLCVSFSIHIISNAHAMLSYIIPIVKIVPVLSLFVDVEENSRFCSYIYIYKLRMGIDRTRSHFASHLCAPTL